MRCAIALGSNCDDPRAHVERAVRDIAALPHTTVTAASGLYRTAPVGPVPQDDFCNAVVLVETGLEPLILLEKLQALERAHGRPAPGERAVPRWGPRALDLDVLLYGDAVLDHDTLQVPHPLLAERAFVLVPLAEVAPDWRVPGHGTVHALAASVSAQGVSSWL